MLKKSRRSFVTALFVASLFFNTLSAFADCDEELNSIVSAGVGIISDTACSLTANHLLSLSGMVEAQGYGDIFLAVLQGGLISSGLNRLNQHISLPKYLDGAVNYVGTCLNGSLWNVLTDLAQDSVAYACSAVGSYLLETKADMDAKMKSLVKTYRDYISNCTNKQLSEIKRHEAMIERIRRRSEVVNSRRGR